MHKKEGMLASSRHIQCVLLLTLIPLLLTSFICLEASSITTPTIHTHASIKNSILIAGAFFTIDVTVEKETDNIYILAYSGDAIPDPESQSIKNYYKWEYNQGTWRDASGHDTQHIIASNCTKTNTTYSFYIGLATQADPGKWTIKIYVDNKETSTKTMNVIIGNFCLFFSTIIGVFEPPNHHRTRPLVEEKVYIDHKKRMMVQQKNIDAVVDGVLRNHETKSDEIKNTDTTDITHVSFTKQDLIQSSSCTYHRSKFKESQTDSIHTADVRNKAGMAFGFDGKKFEGCKKIVVISIVLLLLLSTALSTVLSGDEPTIFGVDLIVWDDTDNQSRYINETITFYAQCNSMNQTIENATVQIVFPGEEVTTLRPMNYTDGAYIYCRSFKNSGIHNYQVFCSVAGYENTILESWCDVAPFETTNETTEEIVEENTQIPVIPAPPTQFSAVVENQSCIKLSWKKGDNANTTYIVRGVGSYPANRTTGVFVYNGTETSYIDEEINHSILYYYRAWSYAEQIVNETAAHQWSEEYTDILSKFTELFTSDEQNDFSENNSLSENETNSSYYSFDIKNTYENNLLNTSEKAELDTICIIDKHHEEKQVVPGSSFFVERIIDGPQNNSVTFVPLFSDSLTFQRIEILEPPVYIQTRSQSQFSEINSPIVHSQTLVSTVCDVNSIRTEKEKNITHFIAELPSEPEAFNRFVYTNSFDLQSPQTVRIWFTAPSWEEIQSGSKSASGHISYLVFSSDRGGFDFEGSSWWDSNWNYRKALNINNANNSYQMIINVTKSSGGNVTCDGYCRDDFGDIRFVDKDGITELDYWMESYVSGSYAIFWVETPSDIETDQNILMYYGNSGASSVSNGSNTFLFFDDFSGDLSKWDNRDPTDITITSGYLQIAGGSTGGAPYGWANLGSNTTYTGFLNGIIEGDVLLGTDSIAEVSFRGNRTADTGYKARMDARSGEGLSFLKPPYTVGVWQIIGTATGTACPTGWGTIKITVSGTSFTLEAFGQTKSITDFDYSAAGEISLQNHYGTSSRFDNVRVRKYASPTPSWNSFGNEESFPTSSNPVPSDGETNIAIPPDSFNITINDLNGDKMNITWRTNASGSWVTFNTTNGGGSGVGNGTYTATNTSWVDSHSTKFWWSVNLTDGTTWTNKTYNFTTSYQPQLSSPYPVNGSFSVLKPTCMIIASDQDKITVTVRFYENTTGSWVLQQTNNSVSVTNPVSVVWDNYSNATGYYVQYWWKVNVTDDKNVYNEKIYCFITSSDNPPELSNEKPTDQSKGILTNLNIINVTISDPDGDSMNWSIDTSPDIGSNSSNNVGNISISCNISGLIAGTTYYWYVNVTDGTMWINETYSFTTNNPPSITLITPSPNGTTGITTQPTCRMWANDTEGDTLNVTWSTNASGSWINKHTNISISANSTVSYKFTDFADYNKTYYWEVYVKDALSNISRWYYFTTKSIETSVDTISPYEVETFSSVIDATGSSDLDNVTLWYQYSSDNSSWNWWNLNWGYYKVFKISNANNSYQMQINVTKSSGGNVTCDGHCRDDFGDVRFIDVDNTTELDYWMESYVSGSYAIFWVETPSDIETDQNILMYYGNSGASSVSNGSNTFLFFDDFSGSSLDSSKWDQMNSGTGSITVNGGTITIASGGDWWDTADTSRAIVSKTSFSYNYITETYVIGYGQDSYNRFFGLRSSSATNAKVFVLLVDSDRSHVTNVYRDSAGGSANWYGENSGVANPGNNKIGRFDRAGDTVYSYYDGSLTNSRTVAGWDLTYVSLTDTYGEGNPTEFDWIRVRKYVPTVPSWNTFGSEKDKGGLISWSTFTTDTLSPWSWSFIFPNGTGYYQFYSIGKKSGSSDEAPPGSPDAICYYEFFEDAPVIHTYALSNSTGSKLNNLTGALDVNKEYCFSVNITDSNGWANIEYINITSWYDFGDDGTTYNQTVGGNLNFFLQYQNTTGTGQFLILWPDDEVQLIEANCTQNIVDADTRIINISFKLGSQARWANSNNTWDTSPNTMNDDYSWNFEICVTDQNGLSASVVDEYGVYKYSSILPDQNWVDVIASPGFDDTSNVVTITYASNYDFNISIYFEENLTNGTYGTSISITNNVYILADTDLNDDITTDVVFEGIGEANALHIFNDSGVFSTNNTYQTVDVQFKVYIPFGTHGGTYVAHVAIKIKQD